MLHLCAFASYEGPLTAEKKCHFTVFGSCVLHSPTLARQMIATRQAREGKAPIPKMIFLTVFGTTEIKCPTLAEEFIDLREAIRSRALDVNQWDFYVAELERWTSSARLSLTLFANFTEAGLPSEEEEIEGLALQHHFGKIDGDSRRILEMGVGLSGSHRRSVIQQAALVA